MQNEKEKMTTLNIYLLKEQKQKLFEIAKKSNLYYSGFSGFFRAKIDTIIKALEL